MFSYYKSNIRTLSSVTLKWNVKCVVYIYIYIFEICDEKTHISNTDPCKSIVIWLWSCGLYNIPYGYKLSQVNVTCRTLSRLSLGQVN